MSVRTATYTYGDVMNVVGKSATNRANEDDLAAFICNVGTNLLWQRYDWRESISTLPPFYLIPDEQDHGAPAVIVPTNFWGLRKVWLMKNATTPPYKQDMTILKDLALTHVRYLPQSISYNSASRSFRVFPRVPPSIGAPDYCVSGEYKIKPTKITAANIASTLLPFDDVYFQTWVEVLKWASLNIAGDPRAGDVNYTNGQKVASGQLAKAYAAIDEMARTENLEGGDVTISPSEPLINMNRLWPAGLGWGM